MPRGGKRPGAGRKSIDRKTQEKMAHADSMLLKLGGDATWVWAMNEAKKAKDFRTVNEIMKYWTDRAKGRAPQSMKLEADTNVQFIFREPS